MLRHRGTTHPSIHLVGGLHGTCSPLANFDGHLSSLNRSIHYIITILYNSATLVDLLPSNYRCCCSCSRKVPQFRGYRCRPHTDTCVSLSFLSAAHFLIESHPRRISANQTIGLIARKIEIRMDATQ